MSAWAVPGYTEEHELGRGASGRVVSAIHDVMNAVQSVTAAVA